MQVFAQNKVVNPVLDPVIRNLEGVAFFNRALPMIINWLILIGVIYFLFTLFLGAFKYISSQGDKNKVQEAQAQLTNAFVGLVILFAVFAILKLVGQVFGLQNLENLQIILPGL